MKVLKYDLSITLQSDKMWWTFLNMVQRNQLKSVSKHEFSWGGVNWCTCTATWNENADERELQLHLKTREKDLKVSSEFIQRLNWTKTVNLCKWHKLKIYFTYWLSDPSRLICTCTCSHCCNDEVLWFWQKSVRLREPSIKGTISIK